MFTLYFCNNWSYIILYALYIYVACDANLVSKASRKQWEEEFYQFCAQPVLQDAQGHHQHALDLIANDDSQGNITKNCWLSQW